MTLEESAKLFTKDVFDTDDPVKVQLVFTLLRMTSKASSRDIRHKAMDCLLESHSLGAKAVEKEIMNIQWQEPDLEFYLKTFE